MSFDEHLTSRARLAIITSLVSGEALTFTELKHATGINDGNLHFQTRKLAMVNYIEIFKEARESRPRTQFRITEKGLLALTLHVRKLQSILGSKSAIRCRRSAALEADDSQVWSQ